MKREFEEEINKFDTQKLEIEQLNRGVFLETFTSHYFIASGDNYLEFS